MEAELGELGTSDGGAWRLDVYQQLPDVWACMEHQRLERQWRKDHHRNLGKIVDQYGRDEAMGAFIIVIDRDDWCFRESSDSGTFHGPLGVWFNPWVQKRKRILSCTMNLDWTVYEQLEVELDRMQTQSHPSNDLRGVWLASGMWEWDDVEDDRPADAEQDRDAEQDLDAEQDPDTPVVSTSPPPQLASACITVSGMSINLRTAKDPELIYILYPVFTTITPVDRISIAQRFASHLPSPSVRLVVAPQFKGIQECIAYAAAVNIVVGYNRSQYGRRFPEYGYAAGSYQMREGHSSNRLFLVLLDLVEWEDGNGVCFLWVGKDDKIMLGRVCGGMRGVAERLGGIR